MPTTLDELLMQSAAGAEPVIYAMKVKGDLRLVLQVPDVAQVLGVSPAVVYTLIRSGQIRVRNLHPGARRSRYLIPIGALIEYLQGQDEPIPTAT